MQIKSVRNLRWGDAAKTVVNADVKFAELPDPVPFAASSKDVEAHGRQVYADAITGKYGPITEYIASVVSPSELARASQEAAAKADNLLAQLKGMDAAQFDAWWEANVTSVAQAIMVLKRLTRLVILKL